MTTTAAISNIPPAILEDIRAATAAFPLPTCQCALKLGGTVVELCDAHHGAVQGYNLAWVIAQQAAMSAVAAALGVEMEMGTAPTPESGLVTP